MIDIKYLREHPEEVKENIKKKFQDEKLPLVDEVIELDKERRDAQKEADELKASRNTLSKQIGVLMKEGKKEEAEEVKAQVAAKAGRLEELEKEEKFRDFEGQFGKQLGGVINEIFDLDVPFVQRADPKKCANCDFHHLCGF